MPFFTRLSNAPYRPKVLVVDSEPDMRLSFSHSLKAKGYEVACVPDGRSCLEEIRHQGYDAVLLREYLPDQDGLSLLNAIRIKQPKLPVIFLTASGPSPVALQRGAFAVLGLPYEQDQLYDVLQKAMGQ